jgi:hypothetical protein
MLAPDLVFELGARLALLPGSIDLIQEPSRGDILSDVIPAADGGGSNLGETLLRWEVADCLPAVAKRTPALL